ncbi:AbrB/MazE/SpoVT family DNA-binding domain-containing protein [Endozoicomonas sp. 8E]|uniref:AbrB/MazE/SpoVT family DNA-binding domain-containing protein n=1 Tax=Endozoicomonas sp. 8E TaxID=3035692 RepID=UPI00293909F1|nr:AbrB/MazE/SpoVT family DNA-binding domain-containing protein [Endozoicomonas sp. 8E]WOG29970.1 AbrB/MazE/SpoVT family DNA-binding domain-containing protein [Endozoicomonas sp. 8E]
MPKLTSKRQVTIPKDICNKLGLLPGDTLKVFERDGVAHLVKMSSETLSGTLACSKVTESESAANHDDLDFKEVLKEKAARKFRGQE